MIKTVFLFGAGASYGCGDVYPHPPPFGDKLYECLCTRFPDSWGSLPSGLKSLFENSFEEGMDCLWKEHADKSSLCLQHMGMYFCHFTPASGKGTLYRELISKLGDLPGNGKGVLLSTLNYDLLVDGELTQAGIDVNYCFSAERESGLPFIKLHGSCNWFLDFPCISRNMQFGSSTIINARMYSLDREDAVEKYLTGDTSLYPVMRLYTKEKPAQLQPNFFENLDKQWSEIIMSAEQVAIIGVRPYPLDQHIWAPLVKTRARILYIGDRDAYQEWQKDSGRLADTIFIAEYFDEGLNSLLEQLFA